MRNRRNDFLKKLDLKFSKSIDFDFPIFGF